MERYMAVVPGQEVPKVNPDSRNVLYFWKTNIVMYPHMALYARWVFSVQAASASSERLFSQGTRLFSKLRQRMTPHSMWKATLLVRPKTRYALQRQQALVSRQEAEDKEHM